MVFTEENVKNIGNSKLLDIYMSIARRTTSETCTLDDWYELGTVGDEILSRMDRSRD